MGKQYDRKEVEEILRRALEQNPGDAVSHDDLVAAAAEVGVDPEAVETAAEEVRRARDRLTHRHRIVRRRRARFARHLTTFLGANLLLFALDILTGPGLWFYFATCGWGIGLFLHGVRVFLPSEHSLERQVERALRREEARAARKHRSPTERSARARKRAATLQRIVDDGVDMVLGQVADRLDRHRRSAPRVRVAPPDESGSPTPPPDDEQRQRHRR